MSWPNLRSLTGRKNNRLFPIPVFIVFENYAKFLCKLNEDPPQPYDPYCCITGKTQSSALLVCHIVETMSILD